MDIKIHATFLAHNDPEAALKFYRDILGFEVKNDVGQGGKRWITVSPKTQPGLHIVLYPHGADPGITEAENKTIAEMMAKGTFGHIVLESADLDGTFEKLKAKGAEVAQPPTDQPWGMRDAAFRDPAGNMVRINHVK